MAINGAVLHRDKRNSVLSTIWMEAVTAGAIKYKFYKHHDVNSVQMRDLMHCDASIEVNKCYPVTLAHVSCFWLVIIREQISACKGFACQERIFSVYLFTLLT